MATSRGGNSVCLGERGRDVSVRTEGHYAQIERRHTGGANVSFCDSHVKWMRVPGAITESDALWDLQ